MSKSPLPPFNRLITGHNDKGLAIIENQVDEEVAFDYSMDQGKVGFALSYTTTGFPVDLNDNKDITKYQEHLAKPPGIVNKNGSIIRVVDFSPSKRSPMHRTVSIDYGIVLIGEFELELDSGEKRTMKVGDICVQRGTMHVWTNKSSTEWGRMMYVLLPIEEIKLGGKALGEDYGDMEGVAASH